MGEILKASSGQLEPWRQSKGSGRQVLGLVVGVGIVPVAALMILCGMQCQDRTEVSAAVDPE